MYHKLSHAQMHNSCLIAGCLIASVQDELDWNVLSLSQGDCLCGQMTPSSHAQLQLQSLSTHCSRYKAPTNTNTLCVSGNCCPFTLPFANTMHGIPNRMPGSLPASSIFLAICDVFTAYVAF